MGKRGNEAEAQIMPRAKEMESLGGEKGAIISILLSISARPNEATMHHATSIFDKGFFYRNSNLIFRLKTYNIQSAVKACAKVTDIIVDSK